MKLLQMIFLCLALALSGCALDLEEEEFTTIIDDAVSDSSGPSHSYGGSGEHNTGCGYDVLELQMPDGELYQIFYAIPCDPYWMLKTAPGDPPPELSGENEYSFPNSNQG